LSYLSPVFCTGRISLQAEYLQYLIGQEWTRCFHPSGYRYLGSMDIRILQHVATEPQGIMGDLLDSAKIPFSIARLCETNELPRCMPPT